MTQLPERKKSSLELDGVRRLNMIESTRLSGQIVQRKILSPIGMIGGYFVSLFGLGFLLYPIVAKKRPLSAHHGAFMCLVSFLILLLAGVVWIDKQQRELSQQFESSPSVDLLEQNDDSPEAFLPVDKAVLEEIDLEELEKRLELYQAELDE